MSGTNVIAIDAGQTGVKVRTAGRDIVLPGVRTHEPLPPQLAQIIQTVTAQSQTPAAISAGVSGLTDGAADAVAILELTRAYGVTRVTLAHDSTTSFLGALGSRRGAVVASGTGVVTLAVGPDRSARVDGWGHLIGDAGSGYWIGREALDAVMRAFDGRGPATDLTVVALAHWPDLTEAYIDLQSSSERVSTIASFATHVAQLADGGDAVAKLITLRAAEELARSVETALTRVMPPGTNADVCAIGGVFQSSVLRDAFSARMESLWLDVSVVAPLGQGIDGAAALTDISPQHPLAKDIASVGRT